MGRQVVLGGKPSVASPCAEGRAWQVTVAGLARVTLLSPWLPYAGAVNTGERARGGAPGGQRASAGRTRRRTSGAGVETAGEDVVTFGGRVGAVGD
jgi:hypothetical protein